MRVFLEALPTDSSVSSRWGGRQSSSWDKLEKYIMQLKPGKVQAGMAATMRTSWNKERSFRKQQTINQLLRERALTHSSIIECLGSSC